MSEIPADIPVGATHVYLQANHITTIRAGVFSHLVRCEELRLSNNDISEIAPTAFRGLTNLRRLVLSTNNLTHISPGTFSGLTNIETLLLFNNKLTHISPGTFSGLTKLNKLYLYKNRLRDLESNLFLDLARPLYLYLGHASLDPDNSFLCDKSLCWLKQEEQDGTVEFMDPSSFINGQLVIHKPECTNNSTWQNFTCSIGQIH